MTWTHRSTVTHYLDMLNYELGDGQHQIIKDDIQAAKAGTHSKEDAEGGYPDTKELLESP